MSRIIWLALPMAALGVWWHWPRLAPNLPLRGHASAIAVLADDPRRTETALDLWQQQPQRQLWILGSRPLQMATWAQIRRRGLDPMDPQIVALLAGHDTVGQLTALSQQLPKRIGRVTLITDQSHHERALAIAQLALGSQGIQVTSPPAEQLPAPQVVEPQLHRQRDELRVQLWRATGWDARKLGLWLGLGSP